MRIITRGLALAITALILSDRTSASAVEKVIHNFTSNIDDGHSPAAGLIADAQGALYGTTVLGGSYGPGTVFKLTPPAKGQTWTETILYSFQGGGVAGSSDGTNPYAGLIADAQGALYGTTLHGGSGFGNGTVFKLTPPANGQAAWTETVLYSFKGGSDGSGPNASLIADKDGALYGTTGGGGSAGEGIVFKLTPPANGQAAWTETVLHSFTGGSDGSSPFGGLIADNQGALYGTTIQNGSNGSVGGGGTVFKLTPPATGQTAWTNTTLYSFCSLPSCTDGADSGGGLLVDAKGVLYGITTSGGSAGFGAVFKLTPPAEGQARWTETVLYSFKGSGSSDGYGPVGSLIADAQGVLYGITAGGGNSTAAFAYGYGTVFKLRPPAKGRTAWTETVLHKFCSRSNCSDGRNPYQGPLTVDNQGARCLILKLEAFVILAELGQGRACFLKASGVKPLDRIVMECLEKEGLTYTLATVGQWRKADQWDEGADLITGKSLSPIILSYATHPRQSLSLEVLEGAAVRGLDLHVKVIDFLEKWLASKDPTTIETAEAIRLAELVSKNFDSAASLRIRLGEQRALEARDITPERNDGQGDTLAQLCQKLLGPAETQRESLRKLG